MSYRAVAATVLLVAQGIEFRRVQVDAPYPPTVLEVVTRP